MFVIKKDGLYIKKVDGGFEWTDDLQEAKIYDYESVAQTNAPPHSEIITVEEKE